MMIRLIYSMIVASIMIGISENEDGGFLNYNRVSFSFIGSCWVLEIMKGLPG